MTTLAVGPATAAPSWRWVGLDTARELSKYYTIRYFEDFSEVPACDVLLIIKRSPPPAFVEAAITKSVKLVYVPIDYYTTPDLLSRDVRLFEQYHLILVHCERLHAVFAPYQSRIRYIEHHAKYALPALATYKSAGYVLWIGNCEYVVYLLLWLRRHPIPADVKILTDITNPSSRFAADRLAKKLGLDARFTERTRIVDGCEIHDWSEGLQHAMMSACKAGLDVKWDDDFGQRHKPATKAQQFIASGIPCAMNTSSYSYEYFHHRGFTLSPPTDIDRWWSREYWEQTASVARQLRSSLSLEAVGRTYRQFIEEL